MPAVTGVTVLLRVPGHFGFTSFDCHRANYDHQNHDGK
jgi:hypothetical protein